MQEQRPKYKITNWSVYNKSLIKRGSITLWFEQDFVDLWHQKEQTDSRGRPQIYSDIAIEICLTVKIIYRLSYRAAQGFVTSILSCSNINLPVPSYTQMHRRAKCLAVKLKRAFRQQGAIDIVVDATGLKVYGEGEWKVRQHGVSKRRTWQKLHLAVDPLTHEITAIELTEAKVTDAAALPKLIKQTNQPIVNCTADGAYDQHSCYQVGQERHIKLVIPPQENAIIHRHNHALTIRNQAISRIRELAAKLGSATAARKQWKIEQHYHERSIAETAMFRFKKLCSNKLFSRLPETMQREAIIKCNIMNKFTSLGMPISKIA